jgi:hypothetical protein
MNQTLNRVQEYKSDMMGASLLTIPEHMSSHPCCSIFGFLCNALWIVMFFCPFSFAITLCPSSLSVLLHCLSFFIVCLSSLSVFLHCLSFFIVCPSSLSVLLRLVAFVITLSVLLRLMAFVITLSVLLRLMAFVITLSVLLRLMALSLHCLSFFD